MSSQTTLFDLPPVAHARATDPEAVPDGFYRHISGEVRKKTRRTHKSAAYTRHPDMVTRFWSKVDKSGECWLWMGAKSQFGHGHNNTRGVPTMAHRLSWQLAFGPIPDGMQVCHRCDVPSCVRPDHLFLGTQSDNIRDCITKGRFKQVKYESSVVEAIRADHQTGKFHQRQLATKYGMAQSHIWRIIHGQSRPVARATDPETSWSAAASVSVTASQLLVLGVLQRIKEGSDEAILEAICRYGLGDQITPSGARTRRDELVEMGYVKDSGRTAVTKSNRKTIIWEVT